MCRSASSSSTTPPRIVSAYSLCCSFRDAIYGAAVTRRLRAMGIRDKPIAPGSPWQNSQHPQAGDEGLCVPKTQTRT
jgi:hypothetical protein